LRYQIVARATFMIFLLTVRERRCQLAISLRSIVPAAIAQAPAHMIDVSIVRRNDLRNGIRRYNSRRLQFSYYKSFDFNDLHPLDTRVSLPPLRLLSGSGKTIRICPPARPRSVGVQNQPMRPLGLEVPEMASIPARLRWIATGEHAAHYHQLDLDGLRLFPF
jgi:hypothetical protein